MKRSKREADICRLRVEEVVTRDPIVPPCCNHYVIPLLLKVIGGELQERLIPVPYSKSSTDQAVSAPLSCSIFSFSFSLSLTFSLSLFFSVSISSFSLSVSLARLLARSCLLTLRFYTLLILSIVSLSLSLLPPLHWSVLPSSTFLLSFLLYKMYIPGAGYADNL